jgi:hypothetical protein
VDPGRIAVVVGSTRPTRICAGIAALRPYLAQTRTVDAELVEALKDAQ